LLTSDLDEFAQCQAQLIPLHAAGLSANTAEFLAYRLLHCMAVRTHATAQELRSIAYEMRSDRFREPPVAQALHMAVHLQRGELGQFFQECSSGVHHLGARLIQPLLPKLRLRALRTVCSAFIPTLPLSRASILLGFGGDVQVCLLWLRELGAAVEPPPNGKAIACARLCTRVTAAILKAHAESSRGDQTGPNVPQGWSVST